LPTPAILQCSATAETRTAMGMKVVDNIAAFFDGRDPPVRVA
jgi:lactate dehydrogenase-like 2-hydroxyacid dehydrogenase